MQAADSMDPYALAVAEPPPERLVVLAERLSRTVAVARALIIAGRTVELTGIEDGIGMLCAKTLDLPRDQAQAMLPLLHEMRAQVEGLGMVLRAPGAPPAPRPG